MANTKAIFLAENASATTLVPSVTAADYVEIPLNSENVVASAQTTESGIIREDRSPAGSVRTGLQIQGSITGELAYGWYDSLIEAALLSAAWAASDAGTGKVTGATVEVDHTGGQTVTGTLGSPFTGLGVGDWFVLQKTGAANHGIAFRIATWTSADLITYDAWSATPTDDGAGVTGVTVRSGMRVQNSNTERLFTYAKKIGQAGVTKYPCYLGITVDGMGLSMQPGQIPSVTFPLVGTRIIGDDDGSFMVNAAGEEVASGGTTIVLSTYLTSPNYTAAAGNSVFSPVNRSSAIMVEGVPSTLAKQFSLQLANNTAGEPVLFQFGNYGTTAGRLSINGTFEAIYTTSELRTAFANDTAVNLALYVVDDVGQAYIIDFPRVKLAGGGEAIAGAEGFVSTPFTFAVEKDSTIGLAIQVIRIPNT